MSQFENVSCKYGAPMGRASSPLREDPAPRSIRLFRVNLDSGGYDDGGAYWGIGAPLYCATDDADYLEFTRANDRFRAMILLGIPWEALKIAPAIPGCYHESRREFCGQSGARHVLRYWGEFVSQHESKADLIAAMSAHYLTLPRARPC